MNLLLHQGALGDWVLTFPILRALVGPTLAASSWSKARLASRLFKHVQPIDIDQPDWTRLHMAGGWKHVSNAFRQHLSGLRFLISFITGESDHWATNIRMICPDSVAFFVRPVPPSDWTGHICDWHMHQLKQQGLNLDTPFPTPRSHAKAATVVHPGSGSMDKVWPIDQFERLLDTLAAHGHPTKVLLGEVELDRWPKSMQQHWIDRYQAEPVTSLDRLVDVLSQARAYLGNDSGPTHLASQLGVPTIALFGPTQPQTWAPQGPNVTILAPPSPRPMSWLAISDVLAAVNGSK